MSPYPLSIPVINTTSIESFLLYYKNTTARTFYTTYNYNQYIKCYFIYNLSTTPLIIESEL